MRVAALSAAAVAASHSSDVRVLSDRYYDWIASGRWPL